MKILIYGCTGTYNYGDELSHETIKMMVKKKYPTAQITSVGCIKNILIREHNTSDNIIATFENEKIFKELKECDFWIYGAGTIMPYAMKLSLDMFNVNNNLKIIGVACMSEIYNETHQKITAQTKVITVRDKYSFNILSKYNNNTYIMPDPMLYHVKYDVTPNKLNGITLSNYIEACKNKDINITDEIVDNLYKSISEIMKHIGGSWIAIPASWNATDYDNDNVCHTKLKQYYEDLEIFNPNNFNDVTNKLCGLNCYFTSRLHTGVVTAGAKIPTVFFGPIKILNLCETWGQEYKNIYVGSYKDVNLNNLITAYNHSINIFPGVGNEYTESKKGLKNEMDKILDDKIIELI
jgi:polysaccharide pyruvyl transferase WcaK-like protein